MRITVCGKCGDVLKIEPGTGREESRCRRDELKELIETGKATHADREEWKRLTQEYLERPSYPEAEEPRFIGDAFRLPPSEN